MNGNHWMRAKELLADLQEVPAHEHATWISRACDGDQALRAELERLLALDAEAKRYFDELDGTLSPEHAPLTQVGVYRITGEIGRGGMGTVYLGQRNDGQFEQSVAIKVVNDSVDDRLLARFRDERRILAQLKHPGIAYLLDGGSLADGRPYFIMEYVRGSKITDYANDAHLDIRARLELFCDVCAAVAHAHRSLVIHRDLKPGNVMVQEDDQGHATIKLLDFGIARIIRREQANSLAGNEARAPDESTLTSAASHLTSERAPTEFGARVLTPRYAAPEQLRGEEATTSSDVYALGLLLHKLLTGTHPFGPDVSTVGDMERAILAGAPTQPSVTAAQAATSVASARSCTPRQLAKQLRGDLDSIILKAIDRDPDQRYPSVGQLADDIQRHLRGQPVVAREATAAYHTRVFLRRHRYAATAALLAVSASVVLAWMHTVSITHERDLARTEAAKARQVSGLLVSMLQSANPEEARGEEISVRELLDRAAGRIHADLADQPDVLARMDSIIGTVYTRLGKYDEADTFLSRALASQQSRQGPEDPETLATMQAMATLAMRRQNDPEAEEILREVLARRLNHAQPDPMLVASTQNDLAVALNHLGKNEEAETLHRAALAGASRSPDADPQGLLSTRNNLAVLLVGKGEFAEAEKLYRETLETSRVRLGPVHPDLANTLNNLGVLLSKQQRFEEAEPLLRESLAMKRKLYDDGHPSIALAMNQLAGVLTKQARFEEAEPLLLQALAMRRVSLAPGHPHIATNLNNLGNFYREQGDYARAEPMYLEAIAICRKSMGDDHEWTAAMTGNLGEMYLRAENPAAAEESFRETLRIRRKNYSAVHWAVGNSQSLLGAALAQQGKAGAAKPLLEKGYRVLKNARGENDQYTRRAKARLQKLGEASTADS